MVAIVIVVLMALVYHINVGESVVNSVGWVISGCVGSIGGGGGSGDNCFRGRNINWCAKLDLFSLFII